MSIKVLGVDPGLALTGYGVVQDRGGGNCLRLHSGTVKTGKKIPHPERLKNIFEETVGLIEEYRPQAVSLEKVFFNRNVRSALTVGEVRGIIILAAARAGIPLEEYAPLQIKNTIAGDGRADKLQMRKMVCLQLKMQEYRFSSDDEADALAVALCHLQQMRWNSIEARRETN